MIAHVFESSAQKPHGRDSAPNRTGPLVGRGLFNWTGHPSSAVPAAAGPDLGDDRRVKTRSAPGSNDCTPPARSTTRTQHTVGWVHWPPASQEVKWRATRGRAVDGEWGAHESQEFDLEAEADQYDDHMVRQMTATEFKARALGLLDEVAAGDEIEITKHGRTVARLIGARGPRSMKGRLARLSRSVGDDESLFSTGAAWNLP